MSFDQIAILALIGAILILFIWGRWRYDLIAFTALLVAVVIGLVEPMEAFIGFGHPAVVTVAAVLIISRALSALFDVEDAIEGAYTLEVSSPGLDRPLTRAGDYERFAGYEARVELHDPLAGRRRFRGRILGLFGDVVRIDMEGQIFDLPFEEIQRAKLIMNDELLALAEAGRAQH